MPEWEGWQKKARAVAAEAGAIREEVPAHGLGAHLASFGFGPDGIDGRKKEIEERIEREERAREQAARRRREQERSAEQARIAAQRAAVEQAERDARELREKEIEAAAEREARRAEEYRRTIDDVRATMDAAGERLDLSWEIRDCLAEREAGDREHYGLFVRRDAYGEWRSGAEALMEKANRHLDEAGKRDPGHEEDGATKTLRERAAELQKTLREDREKIERIENERAQEQTRQQDRSQGRGFSM